MPTLFAKGIFTERVTRLSAPGDEYLSWRDILFEADLEMSQRMRGRVYTCLEGILDGHDYCGAVRSGMLRLDSSRPIGYQPPFCDSTWRQCLTHAAISDRLPLLTRMLCWIRRDGLIRGGSTWQTLNSGGLKTGDGLNIRKGFPTTAVAVADAYRKVWTSWHADGKNRFETIFDNEDYGFWKSIYELAVMDAELQSSLETMTASSVVTRRL